MRVSEWFHRHPAITSLLWGIGLVALGLWSLRDNSQELLAAFSVLFGCGATAMAAAIGQYGYLERSLYRDRIEAPIDEIDEGVTIEHRDEKIEGLTTWARGRDLRETLHAGEAAFALIGATLLGLLAAVTAGAAFFIALLITDIPGVAGTLWAPTLLWVTGIIGSLFILSVLLSPVGALNHWFRSRRMIQGQQLDYLRRIAHTPRGPAPASRLPNEEL